MRRLRTVTALLAVTLSAVGLAAGDPALELRVHPRTCLSPCTIRVIIRAQPHESNRALVLELDSPAYFRSSEISLEGSNAALIHEREFESLPAGPYEVRVLLKRSSRDSLRDRSSVAVMDGTRAGS